MSLLGTFNSSISPSHAVESRGTENHGNATNEVEEAVYSSSQQHSTGEKLAADASSVLSSTETAREKDDREYEENTDEEITRLAQQLTHQSTKYSSHNIENPFLDSTEESSLNPANPNFKAKNWMKNILALSSRDSERYPVRQAGVSFRNLSIHGFGSPTDYQKDVFNSVLQIGGLFRSLMGTGKQKIEILRNFDGLVKSGEMLVVLGRPGR